MNLTEANELTARIRPALDEVDLADLAHVQVRRTCDADRQRMSWDVAVFRDHEEGFHEAASSTTTCRTCDYHAQNLRLTASVYGVIP